MNDDALNDETVNDETVNDDALDSAAAGGGRASGDRASGGRVGGTAVDGGRVGGTAVDGGRVGGAAVDGDRVGGTAVDGGRVGGTVGGGAPPPPGRPSPPFLPRPLRPPSSFFGARAAVALATVLSAVALLAGPSPAPGTREGRGEAGLALPGPALPGPAHAGPAAPSVLAAPGAPALRASDYFTGRAFDTCEAPTLAQMRAWRDSPYGAVGIYFGGRGRGCPGQRELNRTWVTTVHAMGWRLLPLFVGSQAPCVIAPAKRPFALGDDPWGQGTREAGDAVRAARGIGLDEGSPLYLDVEAYRSGDAGCAATTLSFVRAWSREVRRLGHVPGFYSSADSGVRDVEAQRRAGTPDLPDVMWFARWRGQPALYTESELDPAAWTPHARIHQYAGNVAETYGGHRLVIDRDAVDAPVARIAPDAREEATGPGAGGTTAPSGAGEATAGPAAGGSTAPPGPPADGGPPPVSSGAPAPVPHGTRSAGPRP